VNKDLDLTWSIIPPDLMDRVSNLQYMAHKNFNNNVEKALDEYMVFKYNISGEQIKKIVDNTNNFKLKHNNFLKVVQGHAEYYYDGDFLFLMVNNRDLNIYKRWRT